MLYQVVYLLVILQLAESQFYSSGRNERCPPAQECPTLPSACLSFLSQRQALMQTRLPVMGQNPVYYQRQPLLNNQQSQMPINQGLQPVRFPSAQVNYHSVLPTYTPLNQPVIFDNTVLGNSPSTNFVSRQMPSTMNVPMTMQLNLPPSREEPHYDSTITSLNDCCGRCSMVCQHSNRRVRAYHQKTSVVKKTDDNCTHMELKILMTKTITANPDESKRLIHRLVEEKYGCDFHVICSRSDFTYVTKGIKYCQITKNNVTCYAFQTPVSKL